MLPACALSNQIKVVIIRFLILGIITLREQPSNDSSGASGNVKRVLFIRTEDKEPLSLGAGPGRPA